MTWFRVDDTLHGHPKRLRATPAAMGLWVVAGSWSGAYLTEGFVPNEVVRNLGFTRAHAQSLVNSGLWTVADGGYWFHEWTERNPTAETALDLRRKRSEAGRKGGQKSKPPGSKTEASASPGLLTRQKQNGTPSRPVPSPQTNYKTEVVRRLTRGRSTTTTDDEIEQWTAWAGPDVDLESELGAWLRHNADVDLDNPRAALKGWLERARAHAAGTLPTPAPAASPSAPPATTSRPTPTPSTPRCPLHPGELTGSHACRRCAAQRTPPPPDWRNQPPEPDPTDDDEPPY